MQDPLTMWLDKLEAKRWADAESVVALIACVRAAIRASEEIQSQHTAWPGEVDTLADALARLRRLAKGDA